MQAQWIDRVATPAKLEERRLRYLRELQDAREVAAARYAFGRLVDVEQELARRSHRTALLMARAHRKCGTRALSVHYFTLACEARESLRTAGSARQAVHL